MTYRKTYSLLWMVCALVFGMVTAGLAKEEARKDTVTTVAKELICLCPDCGKQSLDQCAKCGEGQKYRNIIASQLKEGKSKDEIVTYFANTYGDQMLGNPRPQGFNRSAVLLPAMVALFGLIPLTVILSRRKKTGAAASAPKMNAATPEPAAEDPRIAAALKEMKF